MGQVGSAMGNPNTFAAEPSGFSGSEWAARLLGGATKGALQGYSNMQNQNSQMRNATQPPMPVPMPQQPQVNIPSGVPDNFAVMDDFGHGTSQYGMMGANGQFTGTTPRVSSKNPFFYGQ